MKKDFLLVKKRMTVAKKNMIVTKKKNANKNVGVFAAAYHSASLTKRKRSAAK